MCVNLWSSPALTLNYPMAVCFVIPAGCPTAHRSHDAVGRRPITQVLSIDPVRISWICDAGRHGDRLPDSGWLGLFGVLCGGRRLNAVLKMSSGHKSPVAPPCQRSTLERVEGCFLPLKMASDAHHVLSLFLLSHFCFSSVWYFKYFRANTRFWQSPPHHREIFKSEWKYPGL